MYKNLRVLHIFCVIFWDGINIIVMFSFSESSAFREFSSDQHICTEETPLEPLRRREGRLEQVDMEKAAREEEATGAGCTEKGGNEPE